MRRSRRPTPAYSRFLSALAAGLLFFITGAIGLNVGHARGPLFATTRWTEGPILEQVALGVLFLLLAAFFYRRLPGRAGRPPAVSSPAAPRAVRHVGGGKSAGARQSRSLP
jgi:hypothetical protein